MIFKLEIKSSKMNKFGSEKRYNNLQEKNFFKLNLTLNNKKIWHRCIRPKQFYNKCNTITFM